jgi:hypothetical protein
LVKDEVQERTGACQENDLEKFSCFSCYFILKLQDLKIILLGQGCREANLFCHQAAISSPICSKNGEKIMFNTVLAIFLGVAVVCAGLYIYRDVKKDLKNGGSCKRKTRFVGGGDGRCC